MRGLGRENHVILVYEMPERSLLEPHLLARAAFPLVLGGLARRPGWKRPMPESTVPAGKTSMDFWATQTPERIEAHHGRLGSSVGKELRRSHAGYLPMSIKIPLVLRLSDPEYPVATQPQNRASHTPLKVKTVSGMGRLGLKILSSGNFRKYFQASDSTMFSFGV